MARSHHVTVSLDLDFDESLWAEAQTDNSMLPANDVVPLNTTLKVDISVPPAVELANDAPPPADESFAGEWVEMPEDMQVFAEEALRHESFESPQPPTHADTPQQEQVKLPDGSYDNPPSTYRSISTRARRSRSMPSKSGKGDVTAREVSRAATWCALGLAASVVAGLVMPGPWAPAAVLALVAVVFLVMQVGAALENNSYKKETKVANYSKLSAAAPPVLGIVVSQVVPAELVAPGGPIAGMLLAFALGLFAFAWLGPTLQGLQVPIGLVFLVTASAFSTAHIAAMLSARGTFSGPSVGCSVLLGVLFGVAYAIRPKPMEVMGGVALMMALLVV